MDEMFSGEGYFEGSTILISGPAGTGKTTFASEFVSVACAKGKKALYITYEESASQITRNMGSVGLDLGRYVKNGKLRIHAERATSFGLEFHLVNLHRLVEEMKPEVVVIDPISSLMSVGELAEVQSMLVRMVDYLKMRDITTILTDLKHTEGVYQGSYISSMADTWIGLLDIEKEGETRRLLRIIKSRGMAHSTQTREFLITDRGIVIIPAQGGEVAGKGGGRTKVRSLTRTSGGKFD
jgi:circadian clock protein KaiC